MPHTSDPREAAFEVLRLNDRGTYSVPTHGLYPVQFNWDSAFAALGYRLIAPERAWVELELLAHVQWPDGMIPHIVFRGDHEGYFPGPEVWRTGRNPPTSGITQPPVLATAIRRLHDLHGPIERERGRTILASIQRWHRWFMTARRDEGTGAILIIHPWESGRDNLIDWDAGMARVAVTISGDYRRRDLQHVSATERPSKADYDRYLSIVAHGAGGGWDQVAFGRTSPFRMADPGMTAILLRANRDLAALLPAYGLEDQLAEVGEITRRLEAGLRALWNPAVEAFTALDLATGRHTDCVSSAAFLAPYAGLTEPEYLGPLLAHFDRIAAGCAFMVPSSDPEHPAFDARRYWRGPVWLVINRLIGQGLAEAGETERAERVRADSARLIARSGFREYFDPLTGEGLGGDTFTWTAAAWLDWVARD